jgi:hypothetical protein
VMTLLHHTNVSTTEHYLGVAGERRTRDVSLRARSSGPRRRTGVNPATGYPWARLSHPRTHDAHR